MNSSPDGDQRTGGHIRSTGESTLRDYLQWYPADLALVSLFVLAGTALLIHLPDGSVPRVAIALPLLFVLPGYAVLALLFPTADSLSVGSMAGMTLRIPMSFGLSLALLPLVVLIVGAVGSLDTMTVIGSLALGTFLVTQLAAIRQFQMPDHRRYQRYYAQVVPGVVESLAWRNRVSTVAVLSIVVLSACIVAATGALVFAIADSPDANEFTQFYVGTEIENGTISTSEYPDQVGPNDSLVFGVTNYEQTTVDYVVIVQLQETNESGDIVRSDRLDRFDNTLSTEETWNQEHRITPEQTGENLRLQYLLYHGEPPESPTADNAYRNLHVWVDVDDE